MACFFPPVPCLGPRLRRRGHLATTLSASRGFAGGISCPRIDEIDNFRRTVYQARQRPIDLIFDGDSITAGFQWGSGHDLFQKLYGKRNAIDFAPGGDRTENVLWRLQNRQLDTLKPKPVMLMIGTNNLNESSSQEIADGITKIVQTYRTQCPDIHVLLLGIFPRGHLPTDGMRAKIKEINGIISKLNDGKHVTYLDIGDKFLTPDGTLTKDVMRDFTSHRKGLRDLGRRHPARAR